MMRGVHIAFAVTGALYFAVAISGYAALGAAAGGNVILALDNGPQWARTLARLLVVVHVLAAYQVGGGGGRHTLHRQVAAVAIACMCVLFPAVVV